MAKRNADSALLLFRESLWQSEQLHYLQGIVVNLIAISYCYEQKRNYRVSDSLNRNAVFYSNLANDPRLYVKLFTNLGNYYNNRGIPDTAVYYYHRAIDMISGHPAADSSGAYLFSVYNSLGSLYIGYKQEDFQSSFYYFRKAEQLALSLRDTSKLAAAYIALGAAYANTASNGNGGAQAYEQGARYMEKAIGLLKKGDSTGSLGTAYCNLGIIYINTGREKKGIAYIERAIQDSGYLSGESQSRVRPYLAIGAAYLRQQEYGKAELYLNKAGAASDEARSRNNLLEVYKLLAQLYLLKKDYKNAFAAQQSYSLLRDSLLSEEKIKATRHLEIKYRTAEKDRKIAANELALSRQQSRIREQEIGIIAGVASTLLLSGLLFALFRNARHRRRLHREQVHNLEQQQEIAALKAMMQGEERERGRLARELHDGIVSQLAAAKLNFSDVQQRHPVLQQAPDFDEAVHQLDDAALDLRKTAHNLMPEILLQQGFVPSLAIYCERMSNRAGFRIYFHLTGVLPELDPDASLSIYRMVQELIQNIMKHARASQAVVQINVADALFLLTVEDNGIGIPAEKLRDDGLLKTARARVRVFSGKMDVRSQAGTGTTVTLEFDLDSIRKKKAASPAVSSTVPGNV